MPLRVGADFSGLSVALFKLEIFPPSPSFMELTPHVAYVLASLKLSSPHLQRHYSPVRDFNFREGPTSPVLFSCLEHVCFSFPL